MDTDRNVSPTANFIHFAHCSGVFFKAKDHPKLWPQEQATLARFSMAFYMTEKIRVVFVSFG